MIGIGPSFRPIKTKEMRPRAHTHGLDTAETAVAAVTAAAINSNFDNVMRRDGSKLWTDRVKHSYSHTRCIVHNGRRLATALRYNKMYGFFCLLFIIIFSTFYSDATTI